VADTVVAPATVTAADKVVVPASTAVPGVCRVTVAVLVPAAAVVPRAPRTTVRVLVLIAVTNIISVPTFM